MVVQRWIECLCKYRVASESLGACCAHYLFPVLDSGNVGARACAVAAWCILELWRDANMGMCILDVADHPRPNCGRFESIPSQGWLADDVGDYVG